MRLCPQQGMRICPREVSKAVGWECKRHVPWPTLKQVMKETSPYRILEWYRFLPTAQCEDENVIVDAIVERQLQLGAKDYAKTT